ncbi:unnamed protein product [Paramecium sonneborni]|uniref:RING-type domain-containing protein n=1 Tax=Paramecium sonneborni TaxID=65129 RepID=A0A8S1RGE9_9CILI|nr:unnamed protein product [Paramecium sonneborni]
MNQQEEYIFSSVMIHSKQEVLEFICKNQIYFPPHLQSKLLLWNCFPIVNFNISQIEMSFGSFFYQIIQLSQIQEVKNQFCNVLRHKLIDLQSESLICLCRFIFQKESLSVFPQSNEFKAISIVLQESFVYEKHSSNKNFSCYKSLNGNMVQDLNEQDIKYRILLYLGDEKDGSRPYLIFSSNNNIPYLQQCNLIPNKLNQQYLSSPQVQFNCEIQNFEKVQLKQSTSQSQNNENQQQTIQNIVPNSQNCFQQYQKLGSFGQNFVNHNNINQNNNFTNPQKNNWQIVKDFANHQKMLNNGSQNSNNAFNIGNSTAQQQQQQIQYQTQQKQPPQQEWHSQQKTSSQMSFQKQLKTDYSSECTDINQFQKQNSFSLAYTSITQPVSDEDVFSTQHIINETQEETKNRRIITFVNKSTQQDNQECEVCADCYNPNSSQAILTPCCQKKLHAQCVQVNLFQKAKDNANFQNIKCYSCEKSLESYQDFIKSNIAKQHFIEIVKKQVLANIPLKCFNCSLAIEADQQILSKQDMIECQRCKKKLCSLCRQEYHGKNQQNQQCPSLSKEIQKAIQGMPILVCPFCNLMQTKDEKCNHVSCFGCQKDLCSACSADRIPIKSHGNHYHRKGCENYKPWEQKGKIITKEEYEPNKCENCKLSKKPCKYPISLQEYKNLKQF